MIARQILDGLFENYIEKPSAVYREGIGPPIHLDTVAFELFVSKLNDFRSLYPNMAYWQIVDYKSLNIAQSDRDQQVFGRKLISFKDFFRQMHPEYVHPYLRWRSAAFDLIHTKEIQIAPLNIAYRFGMPLKTLDTNFYWFTMNSTIVQIDADGRIVTALQTFYREMKWSTRNLRPVEASISIRNKDEKELEQLIISKLAIMLRDEFTNTEIDLLGLYANGKTPDEILAFKGWSKHTLHEYNANILRKAKLLFVYNFQNARNFAEYCKEKGFIQFK